MASGSMDFRLNLLANTAGLQQGVNGAKFAVNALVAAMAAVGVGLSVQGLAQAADSYTNLSARINIATKDGGNFNQAMAGVHQVALATNSNLTTTADLFTRLNAVGKDMGITQQQALDLTKTVTQAIKIGGGSAQAADGAVTQFIQAMQGGVLRGEEFNSIMEGGYGLAEALAKGLGVTTGELRKMAEAGELSSERVVKALQSQSASVQATYDKFPTTISNALQRISTSWEILIGKMDQANGTSSTVAQWLVLLADNISELDFVLKDIGDGFIWVGDQLKKIDPATIEALKIALVSAYEALKELGSSVGTTLEAFVDVINTVLSQLFDFGSAVDTAQDQTNGFTKTLQVINLVIGALSDGFAAIGIGVNLFVGALYSAASAWANLVSKFAWGNLKEEAIASMTAMQAKSEEFYQKASDGAINFKSKAVEALDDIGKTQQQKDNEAVASSKEKLNQILSDLQAEVSGKKTSEDEKLQAVQAYAEAAIKANKGVIDGVMQADLISKGYMVSLDETGKIAVTSMLEAKKATEENAKANELAIENAKKAEADYQTFLKASAVEKITLAKQIEDAKKSGDLNALLSAQNSLAAIDAKEAELNTARKARNAEVATGIQSSADKARKAAQALGLDLDVALNRVSEKFASNKVHLDNYANGLTVLGAKGTQATEALYQGWEKWAEKAKNQAEIEAAKQQLLSFEKQGVLSAKQVQMGMEYLDQINGKIPENISEIEKAYKLLGVTSKEEAAKIADSQMRAFNVMKQSGTASAEQVRQALINMADKIYASGNAAKIAWYEGQLAANGLASSVNEVGKVTVDAGSQMETSMQRVSNATYGAQQSFRDLGDVAREEAHSSSEAWAKALEAQTGSMHATPQGEKTRLAFDQSGVVAELKAMGYDDKKAAEIARTIIDGSKLSDGYRNASTSWLAKNGLDVVGAFAGGGGGTSNANYVREQLERYSQYSNKTAATLDTGGSKTVKYELSTGKNKATVYGSSLTESNLNSILTELETINKST
ncbi:tape measure protein [Acinetobacter guillouiae]|uniref:tape measure protein n=1 Tax=Acinetobacter guillouiae TaxID=106649 RepID=UPI001CD7E09E|nr:tape measure protein [Acinetobacter guillouiae]